MAKQNVVLQRLQNQGLTQTMFTKPEEVVRWMGAVQAQEFAHTKWSLAMRMSETTDEVVEQAFNEGKILRTHVMRPTWHFVAAEDIRWLLALTAPRVHAVSAYYYRQQGLDSAFCARSNDLFVKALQGGKQLTRTELQAIFVQEGIVVTNLQFIHLLMYAELEQVICSGPRKGKQFTYALLDERVPQVTVLERNEALAELTRRYFTSHGPATIQDFVWWSGLTTADAKEGLKLAGTDFQCEVINGKTYWFNAAMPAAKAVEPLALLSPLYDEYTIAYKDRRDVVDPAYVAQAKEAAFAFDSCIVFNGRVIGTWKRTEKSREVIFEMSPLRPFSEVEMQAIRVACEKYRQFKGLALVRLHVLDGQKRVPEELVGEVEESESA